MSKKRLNPFDDPPSASSSQEEETSIGEGEEEEYSSSEEEGVAASTKKPEPALTSTKKEQVSDSESDSEPVAKPVTVVKKKKKQDSKKVKTLEKSETKKGSSETDGGADAKKVKRVSAEEEKKSEEAKKRVWSEEDEIAVLQGFTDYQTENKVSPYDDTNAFYQYVKESVSFDVSKSQFMEKVRNLKKRFETKGKNGAKAHNGKAFELAKLIWGVNGMAPELAVKSKGKSKTVVSREELVASLLNGKSSEEEGDTKGEEVVKFLARFGVNDFVAQRGWSRLGLEDKKRFEEQLSALQVQEFELYSKRSGLIHEVVTKMAETLRSNS